MSEGEFLGLSARIGHDEAQQQAEYRPQTNVKISKYTEEAMDEPSTATASFKPAVRQEFQPFRRSRQTKEFKELMKIIAEIIAHVEDIKGNSLLLIRIIIAAYRGAREDAGTHFSCKKRQWDIENKAHHRLKESKMGRKGLEEDFKAQNNQRRQV
jgi:hypothetical protein